MSQPNPVEVALPVGRTAVAITAGTAHTCAVLDDGSAACWGSDSSGQLGDDAPLVNQPTPVPVALPVGRTAVTITAGAAHTCAILDDGSAVCWGSDGEGELGDNPVLASTSTPVAVALPLGRTASAISAGDQHTCAILDNGRAACWGGGASGQLGNGGSATRAVPVAVALPVGRTAVSITAGGYDTCAILDSGSTFCSGNDANGELGNDSALSDQPTPVPIGLPAGGRAVAISAGDNHTCAILDDGGASCWGFNGSGELGNGIGMPNQPVAANSPRALVALSTVGRIADLSVALEDVPAQLAVGGTATITARLVNTGPDTASGIQVALVASGLDLVPLTIGQGSVAGGQWSVGTLAGGGQTTLTLRATATAAGIAGLTVEITGEAERDPDSTPANGAVDEDDRAAASITTIEPAAPPTVPPPAPAVPPSTPPEPPAGSAPAPIAPPATTNPPPVPLAAATTRARVNRLTLKLSPSRDRSAPFFVGISGRLVATSVPDKVGCAGVVVITGRFATGKAPGRAPVSRRATLKLVNGTCTYTSSLKVTRKQRGKARSIRITSAFPGNAALQAATAPGATFRFG